MSFQKAHNVSNELGQVIVTSGLIDTDTSAAAVQLEPSVAVAGINYRILELGYTVIVAGTNSANTNFVTAGVEGSTDDFLRGGDMPANPAVGMTVSTADSSTDFEFRDAGDGKVDADGVPQLESGYKLLFNRLAQISDGPKVVFYAKLAPNVQHKD